MKVYNQKSSTMTEEDKLALRSIREHRRFNAKQYIELKTALLRKYLVANNLKACVVAVSGGIDSAVVLGLVEKAAYHNDITVVPVILPAYDHKGVTGQFDATQRANGWVNELALHREVIEANVTPIAELIEINALSPFDTLSDWAKGQIVPYARTPVLYTVATSLTDQGKPAVIIGTTNRDEGAYLGYVGKASDGMVDIQLISDLHKSEVYAVAKELHVTDEILRATPTGDMFDNRSDEEVFGAEYDYVELHLTKRGKGAAAENLEKLHKYNQHKYFAGSPAIHLDIFESGVAGGWATQFETKYWDNLRKQGISSNPALYPR